MTRPLNYINQTIKIPSTDHQACVEFSELVTKTNMSEYSRRGQDDEQKVEYDNYIGKVAEFGVYHYFKQTYKTCEVSLPDLAIYGAVKKSFDADLKLTTAKGSYNVHVKCHRTNSAFESSWIFQKKDELVNSPNENDLIALCSVYGDEVTIKIIDRAKLFQDIYGKPIAKKFEKYVGGPKEKVALYYHKICETYNVEPVSNI